MVQRENNSDGPRFTLSPPAPLPATFPPAVHILTASGSERCALISCFRPELPLKWIVQTGRADQVAVNGHSRPPCQLLLSRLVCTTTPSPCRQLKII